MSKHLSASTLDLIVRTLELPSPVLSASALRRFPREAAELKHATLISAVGYEPVLYSSNRGGDPRRLQWSAEDAKFGYFSEDRGWITVPGEDIASFAVDVHKVISELTHDLAIQGRRVANELVANHVWDSGSGRIGQRPKRLPVLFGRRLRDRHVWQQLKDAARTHPTPGKKVLLTTTPLEFWPEPALLHFVIIPIAGILAAGGTLRIGSETIAAAIDGTPRTQNDSIHLSADGRLLEFFGQQFRFVKGIRQRDIVRLMYQRYLSGELLVASDTIIDELDLNPKTRIRDVFKKHPAWGIALIERSGMCGFCLPDR